MTESKEIRMQPKKMLTVLYLNYGIKWTIAGLAGITVFIVLGLALDLRFLILALIWIFLIYPLMIAFLYFYYGMEPLTAFNTMPHKLVFDDDGILVRIIEKENDARAENDEISYKEYKACLKDFKTIKQGPDYVLLFFGKKGWIWVPPEAFDSFDAYKEAIIDFK